MTSHLTTGHDDPTGRGADDRGADSRGADDRGADDRGAAVGRGDDPLAWASEILWPDRSARLVVAGRDATRSGQPTWWASPAADSPKLLLPANSPAAAKRAVRRYHDGFTVRRWARSAAAEVAMTSPRLAGRLLGDVVVTVDGPPDAADRGVLGGLRELFARHDLRFAISLASPKTNQKPVIQVLDDSGMVLGWAKVGWNPWTDALVTNEAAWLHKPAKPPLITPTVLHDTVLAGRRVVVASSVTPGRRPKLRRSTHPDPRVLAAIAGLGTPGCGPIVTSAWWASVEQVVGAADDAEASAIDRVVGDAAGLEFSLGAWHGDFTPWNVMTVRGLAEVIDWEFAADGVPLGFDLCHHHTQVATETLGLSPDDALDHSARLTPQGLALLGVNPHTQIATWNLYLIELIRRTLALRIAGVDTAAVHQGRAALRRLQQQRTTPKNRRQ